MPTHPHLLHIIRGNELDSRWCILRKREITLIRALEKCKNYEKYQYLDGSLRKIQDEMARIEIALEHGENGYSNVGDVFDRR